MKPELASHLEEEGATNIIERPCGCLSWYEPRPDEIHERRCLEHIKGYR